MIKIKKIIEEFREFAARGNVIDLAVAVIIGNAINKIVTSLVQDMLMPILGLFIGRIDISSLKFTISSRFTGENSINIGYGSFLQAVLNFLILTFCIFIMLKMLNKLRTFSFIKDKNSDKEEPESTPQTTEEILSEIRDLLKSQNKNMSDFPDHLEEKH